MSLAAAVLIAGAFLDAPPPTHFDITASYAPRKAGGEVAVRFVARDPDVKINETPAPRLKLEGGPLVVAPPPAPARAAAAAKEPKAGEAPSASYLDLTLPVTFPVTLAAGTAAGAHDVKGTVTYFYCSKREHWCRRGVTPVAFPVTVP
jgi:hypothetical protein